MPDSSLRPDKMDKEFEETFSVDHGFVRGYSYYWKETPHTGFFGPQNGAIFKLIVFPSEYPASDFPSDKKEVSISLDATWYFHAAYGTYEKYGSAFAEGPMKEFNESSRYHMTLTNHGNIEPGHYMFEVTCRARDTLKVRGKSPEEKVIARVAKIIEAFRVVVIKLWPGGL